MSCNCQMSGTKLPYRTPGAYLSAANDLPAGPARERAMRSAALAFATAAAAERGDMRLVRSGLRGLGMLGTAPGTQTASQLDASLRSMAGDGLAAALRLARVPETTIALIGTVRGIIDAAAGVLNTVATFIPDQGAKKVLRWFGFILTGRNPPGLSEDDVRTLADLCQATDFLSDIDDQTSFVSSISSVAGLAGPDARQKAADFVSLFVAFFNVFRSRLCSSDRIQTELRSRTGGGAPPPPPAPLPMFTEAQLSERLRSFRAFAPRVVLPPPVKKPAGVEKIVAGAAGAGLIAWLFFR